MDRQRCAECGERFDPGGMHTFQGISRSTCSSECAWLRETKNNGEFASTRWKPGCGFDPLMPRIDPVEMANLEERGRTERIMEVF